MAMVLIEVFMGGPEIPLRVKEEQVERIFHLFISGSTVVPDLLHTLQAMVKVRVVVGGGSRQSIVECVLAAG